MILHVTGPVCLECHLVLWRLQHKRSWRVWVFASKNFISSEKHKNFKVMYSQSFQVSITKRNWHQICFWNCTRIFVWCCHPHRQTIPVVFFPLQELCLAGKLLSVYLLLHGHETSSVVLKERRRLRMFENRNWRIICGLTRNEVIGRWKLHIKELYCS